MHHNDISKSGRIFLSYRKLSNNFRKLVKKSYEVENQMKKGDSKNRTVSFGKNTISKTKPSHKYQLDESKKTSQNFLIRSDLS